MKQTKAARDEAKTHAIERLRRFIAPGATVYTVLMRHSDMSRAYRVMAPYIGEHGAPGIVDVTGPVARACGYRLTRDGRALIVRGAGFNGSHDIGYSIGRALFGVGEECIARGIESRRNPHFPNRERIESDGGYLVTASSL